MTLTLAPAAEAPERLLRRLTPPDLDAFRAHLLRLDLQTRRDRFSHAMSDQAVAAYAEEALRQGLVYGCELDGVLRGAAELQPMPEAAPERAGEAAFTVEAPFRRRGLGSLLFRRLLLAARNRGIGLLVVRCLPFNRAMQALARKHGATIVEDEDEVLGRIVTAPATPVSLWQETVHEGLAAQNAWLQAGRRWMKLPEAAAA